MKSYTLKSKDIALVGILTAIIIISKISLEFLPNIELVTLFIILYTLTFKKHVIYVIAIFILVEGIRFGFGIWWVSYLYIWPLLALLTHIFRNQKSLAFWSIFSASFGLGFGALTALPYLFISGLPATVTYWISGIPFDITHSVGNFAITLIIFLPLQATLRRCHTLFISSSP